MGDSYHVVRSEQDIFMARGHLAGRGMLLLPAIAAGPRGGPGPIRAPDLRDDASLRGGSLSRATGPIKVGVRPFGLSLSLFCCPCLSWTSSSPALRPPVVVRLLTPPSQLKSLLHADGHVSSLAVRSERRCTSYRGGIAPRSIPLKFIGGAFGQFIAQGTERP